MTSLAVLHTYINLNLYQLPRRSCNKSFIKFEKRLKKKKKEKAKLLSRCGLCSRDLYSPYLALISCVISRCCRTISSTTDGSAKVETSPSSSGLSAATFLNMRRMIFPDRVFGRPDTTWWKKIKHVELGQVHSRITCFFPRWVKITVFFMRARALYRHQTLFPLVPSQDFSPQKMRQNLHVFPRFIPAAHRRMTLGLHVFPRLTRCMFFCTQQQLHVFPQPCYE